MSSTIRAKFRRTSSINVVVVIVVVVVVVVVVVFVVVVVGVVGVASLFLRSWLALKIFLLQFPPKKNFRGNFFLFRDKKVLKRTRKV